MNIRKEGYVPPLIRPSGTFSHREKALTTPALSLGERVARRVMTCAGIPYQVGITLPHVTSGNDADQHLEHLVSSN